MASINTHNPINIINEKKSNLEDKNGLLINKKPGKGVEYDKFSYYSINLPYTVYRTEQCGLGHTKWIIKTKFD